MSTEVASTVAAHEVEDNNVVRTVYSKGISNVPLVGIRLNEIETANSEIVEVSFRYYFTLVSSNTTMPW